MNMTGRNWISKLVRAPADGGAPPADPGNPGAVAPGTEPPAAASPQVTEPAAPDYSWVPEQFMKDGKPDTAALRADWDAMTADKARLSERDIPTDAAGYELSLPEDLTFEGMPEGFKFEISQDEAVKPLLDEMRSVLHKHQLPQEAASEFLGLMAKYQAYELASTATQNEARYTTEMAALGANANTRVSEVIRLLDAKLPKEQADGLKAAATSANGVRALEALLSPSRVPSTPASPAGPDTANMTPRQKIDYANQQQAQRRA